MYLSQFHWGGWTYSLLNKGKSEGYSPTLLPSPTPATARGRAPPSVLVSREGSPGLPLLEDPLEHWNPWEAQRWKTPGHVLLLQRGQSLLTSHCSIMNICWCIRHILNHWKIPELSFSVLVPFVYSALRTLAVLFFPECLRFLFKWVCWTSCESPLLAL